MFDIGVFLIVVGLMMLAFEAFGDRFETVVPDGDDVDGDGASTEEGRAA